MPGVYVQGLVEVGQGLVILALGRKDAAPVIVGFRMFGVDLQGLVEVRQG